MWNPLFLLSMRDPFNMLCGKKAAKGAAKTEQARFCRARNPIKDTCLKGDNM